MLYYLNINSCKITLTNTYSVKIETTEFKLGNSS